MGDVAVIGGSLWKEKKSKKPHLHPDLHVVASLASSSSSSSYRNSLSYILHPRVKCQHSAASHFIRRYFVLVRPAHARRRHVWPRQCLDERDTHTTHNAPIGFGPLLQHLCEPFSFLPLHLSLSLFPDQDSTTCSSVTPPPLPSGTRHRAAAPCNTNATDSHCTITQDCPRPIREARRQMPPARFLPEGRPEGTGARPTTQASYLICSCIAVCVRACPLSRKSQRLCLSG